MPAKQIGDYLLYDLIGQGSFGSVFTAVHKDNKNEVLACKMI